MHSLTAVVISTALIASASGRDLAPNSPHSSDRTLLEARALPANAPHGYTPQTNNCPSSPPTIRDASSLSIEETAWLEKRRPATVVPMADLLRRLNITGLDTDNYLDGFHENYTHGLPNIGIAVSGGGYRAMLTGAGVLEAYDSRTPNSTSPGQLGGLLQSATYVSALSGGSWLVGSLFSNNFTSVHDILAKDTDSGGSGDLWQLGNSIFVGPDTGDIQLFDSVGYYSSLVSDTNDKSDAGFNITITDFWGRALSYQLVNASDGGSDYTFSSIADQEWFSSGTTPMPFVVVDGRKPGESLVSSNTTVYHFSPYELGTEDPTVYAFAPLKYVGTNFSDGSPRANECVTGFDNVGFVMGTSSSLFNTLMTEVDGTQSTSFFSSALQDAIAAVLTVIGNHDDDIADYPNPFYNYHNDTSLITQDEQLTLVDGGEDGQNIPLHPLIQPYRHVDVIFAVDSSADTNASNPTHGSAPGWPDGYSLIATYERSQAAIGNGTVFPSVPDVNTFVNQGLNNRPTFFGCDASNLTGPSPLIVYLPNAPYVFNSNVSTFDLDYNDTERNAIVLNGYNMATQGNASIDAQWPTCVGCAILSRSLDRTGTTVPEVCVKCFNKYCWDGKIDSSSPKPYVPSMKSNGVNVKSGAAALTASAVAAVAGAILTSLTLL